MWPMESQACAAPPARALNTRKQCTPLGPLPASLRSKTTSPSAVCFNVIEEARCRKSSIVPKSESGMCSPGRPIGNLCFWDRRVWGKTRLVEATAESLVGDARAVIKIDCAEFQHSHEIAKLIGSPPQKPRFP